MGGRDVRLRGLGLCLLVPLASAAGVTDVAGATLAFPAECTSPSCTLTLGAVSVVTPTARFETRAFGDVPGPTLRAAAGETVTVTVINALTGEDNAEDASMNTYRHPNTTNLHAHGLHVSSAVGADDVFAEIEPLGSGSYEYAIPACHMGGTHYYHPHHHGSTALQVGGGAGGFFIVEDGEDEVPPEVAAMEEVLLFFAVIDLELQRELQETFNKAFYQTIGTEELVLLTNGQTAPTRATEGCFAVPSTRGGRDRVRRKTYSPHETLKRDDHLGPNHMSSGEPSESTGTPGETLRRDTESLPKVRRSAPLCCPGSDSRRRPGEMVPVPRRLRSDLLDGDHVL